MKKNVLIFLLVVTVLCLTFGFTYYRSKYSLNIQISIKDLPEEGIILISPSNPVFDEEVSSLAGSNASASIQFIDAAEPFCVFIKNTGTREIAGYRLKWELLKNDGKVITRWSSASAPELLSGDETPFKSIIDGALPLSSEKVRFISLEAVLAEFLYSIKNSRVNQTDEAIKRGNAIISQLDALKKENIESTIAVTISVDSVYFKDGTFVGPDTGGLLSETQGYIDAERDLATLAQQYIDEKRGPSELFDKIKLIADAPDPLFNSSPTETDFKGLFLKIHARNLLRVREKTGESRAINNLQRSINRKWVKLQKKATR